MQKQTPVAVVGAGFIADVHLRILAELEGKKVVAICDKDLEKAKSLARKYRIPEVFGSIEELIQKRPAEHVHILTPPNAHAQVALPFLEAGWNVFLEKPMAETPEECKQLVLAAEKNRVKLHINHTVVAHAAHLQCKKIIEEGNLGKVHHILLYWNMPLRQIAAQQFGHWMFQKPVNILLEQCIHPLSQIYDLLGNIHRVDAVVVGQKKLAPGYSFYDTWNLSLVCEKATAQIFFSVGQNYKTHGMTAICDDGQINVDFGIGVCTVQRKTRWPEFYDAFSQGRQVGKMLSSQNWRNLWNFALSTLRLQKASDYYHDSMRKSIATFYAENPQGGATFDGKVGLRLIELCEIMISQVKQEENPKPQLKLFSKERQEKFDAVIIGGTGFIGKKVVDMMIGHGAKVLVAARNIKALSEIFYHERVTVVSADIANSAQMEEIIEGTPLVIHLAHGGAASTWQDVERTMIGGTRNIAQACLKHSVHKLIYVGTIASLYLGNKKDVITGKTPLDPQIEKRGLYSRGKAKCEEILLDLHKQERLPLCILRPGVVIGEAGNATHSGVGLFNQDAYCLGWNEGKNPLPLVLVEDVAQAICLAAASEQVVGKSYNIVGDIRLTAREYIAEWSKATGRKLRFIPQSVYTIQALELGKWLIKVLFQRRKESPPSFRDLKSRGLVAQFDCKDLKADVGWVPETNPELFLEKGIRVYGKK